MIITVTLNPAVDKSLRVERLVPGELNRVDEVDTIAGGKGINVGRIIHQLDEPVTVMGFLGGGTGEEIDRFLAGEGLDRNFTWTEHPTRVNMKVIEADGRETEINEPGRASARDFNLLNNTLTEQLWETELLILSGSLPTGVPGDAYNQLLQLARNHGVKTIIDTAGSPLKQALKEGPFLVKPNLHEMESLLDRRIDSTSAVLSAVDYLLDHGVRAAAISMGRDGAIFADRNKCLRVRVPEVVVSQTTVGAGDSMVAGLGIKIMEDSNLEEMACFSSALAASYVRTGRRKRITKDDITEMIERLKLEILR